MRIFIFRYYELKIEYHEHEDEYREIALATMHIYHTPMILVRMLSL